MSTALLIASTLVGGAATAVGSAQASSDQAWYERFVNGVAAFTYNVAWPTATYQRVGFGPTKLVQGGADVSFRLHGKSAFADGDLWVDVVMHVRSGQIAGIEWGDNNGFFPPGLTTKTVLEGLNAAVKASNAPPAVAPTNPSPAAFSVACVYNSTKQKIRFNLQRGSNRADFALDPDQRMIFSASAADRLFEITFDNSFADGYQPGALRFNAAIRSPRPDSCDDDVTFMFVSSGDRLGLATQSWLPGFPSPWDDTILQSTTKGSWVCATGYRPYPWRSSQGLECIGDATGVIGLSLVKQPNGPFLKISDVYAGSPASLAGLTSGITVVSIDGVSTDGLDVNGAVGKLRGRIGSKLRLGIAATNSDPTVVTLTRQ